MCLRRRGLLGSSLLARGRFCRSTGSHRTDHPCAPSSAGLRPQWRPSQRVGCHSEAVATPPRALMRAAHRRAHASRKDREAAAQRWRTYRPRLASQIPRASARGWSLHRASVDVCREWLWRPRVMLMVELGSFAWRLCAACTSGKAIATHKLLGSGDRRVRLLRQQRQQQLLQAGWKRCG